MRKASDLTAVITRRLREEESAVGVRAFETFFYGWLARARPGLLKEIRADATVMSPDLRATLTRAVHDAQRELGGASRVTMAAPDSYREDGGEA